MTVHRTGSSIATLLGAALAIASPLASSDEPAPMPQRRNWRTGSIS